VNVHFACPECGVGASVELADTVEWQCPACDHLLTLDHTDGDPSIHQCAVCRNAELYKKKDFPHWLGMTILVAACLGSIIPYYLYHQWLTWTILIGSAVIDGLLYLWVGDAVVCYRCNAHYRGGVTAAEHQPFELVIAERYRQERLRRERLQASQGRARG
jgi:hypothetical protein